MPACPTSGSYTARSIARGLKTTRALLEGMRCRTSATGGFNGVFVAGVAIGAREMRRVWWAGREVRWRTP